MTHKFLDRVTTLVGLLIAAIVAAGIDYAKLAHGDGAEVQKLGGAIAIFVFGLFTNKTPQVPPKLLVALLCICAIAYPVSAQVTVAFQPENMVVLKALNVKGMGLWNIRACNDGASQVSIPPERLYMAAGEVHWIEPVRAQAVIADARQHSVKGQVLTYITYGGMAATGLTGFGAIAASTKTVAAIASGTLLANKFKEQVQSELPGLGPYIDKLLTGPLVLAPGGCDTRQAFAGKLKGAHSFTATINLPSTTSAVAALPQGTTPASRIVLP